MVILAKGNASDYNPSMLNRVMEYAKEKLNKQNIMTISLNNSLKSLQAFEDDRIDCIIIDDLHLINEIIQKTLIPIVSKNSDTKDIILIIDRKAYDERYNPLADIATKNITVGMKEYTIIDGNLLDADADFICHQVNCQGKMNSGVAKAIRNKYPDVFNQYKSMWSAHRETLTCKDELLGKIQYVQIYNSDKPKRPYYIVNMFAQDNYGYNGGQYTSLNAFEKCLKDINKKAKGYVVAFPWKVGCVRGGADWDLVLPMICGILTDVKEVQFYRLDLG